MGEGSHLTGSRFKLLVSVGRSLPSMAEHSESESEWYDSLLPALQPRPAAVDERRDEQAAAASSLPVADDDATWLQELLGAGNRPEEDEDASWLRSLCRSDGRSGFARSAGEGFGGSSTSRSTDDRHVRRSTASSSSGGHLALLASAGGPQGAGGLPGELPAADPAGTCFADGRFRTTSRSSSTQRVLVDAHLQAARDNPPISVGPELVIHLPPEGQEVSGPSWTGMTAAAAAMVDRVLGAGWQPPVFKLGITANVVHRFHNFSWGYWREGYEAMVVLCATTPRWAAALERHLIARYGGISGCRNTAPGGESTPRAGPVYVYIVSVAPDNLQEFWLRRARKRSRLDI